MACCPTSSARVSFLRQASERRAQIQGAESVRVPARAAAVAVRRGSQVVFVIEDGVVHPRPVRLGNRNGDSYVLLEGPQVGSRVVTHPPGTLTDGSPVQETAH